MSLFREWTLVAETKDTTVAMAVAGEEVREITSDNDGGESCSEEVSILASSGMVVVNKVRERAN